LDSRNKLRNSLRFLLGVLHDFSTARAVPVDQLLPIDRCFLHELRLLQQEIDAAYESFSFIRGSRVFTSVFH
jgi:isoleucyl-tRNA synthetase